MRKIVLANGEQHEVVFCGAADGYLWLDITDIATPEEAERVFGDPRALDVIDHDWDGNDRVTYQGYTALIQADAIPCGVRIVLARERTD